MENYNLPVYTNRNTTKSGEPYSEHITNETLYVYNSMAVLFGMPDRRYRVKIKGLQEVDAHSEIEKVNQFKVDYKHTGNVYFHPDFKEKTVLATSYYSRGLQYFPAGRIWTKVDSLGNVLQTLEDVIDLLENIEINKEELQEIINYAEKAIEEGHRVMVDMYTAIDDGKETRNNLEAVIQTSRQQIYSLGVLVEEATQLEKDIKELQDFYGDVVKTHEELKELYDNAYSLSNKLTGQLSQGGALADSLESLIPEASKINTQLKETNRVSSQLYGSLTQIISRGDTLLSRLEEEQTTGGVLLEELKDLNIVVTQSIEKQKSELKEIQSNTNSLIYYGEKLKEELEPIIANGEQLKEDLQKIIDGSDLEGILEKMHEHSNKWVLDRLYVDSAGRLEYDGKPVGTRVFTQPTQPLMNNGDQWHREIL